MVRRTGRRRTPAAGGRPQLGTWDSARLVWRLFRDPRVPSRIKTVAPALALLYLVLPVDVIPDFFLGIGQVDDLGVLGLAIALLAALLPRLAPPAIVEEHLAGMGVRQPRMPDRGEDEVVEVDPPFRVRR